MINTNSQIDFFSSIFEVTGGTTSAVTRPCVQSSVEIKR